MLGKRKRSASDFKPVQRNRRKAIEEITFDPQARQEFLTGFHKRKLQRQKHAQEAAALKEREERRQHRAQLRAERQAYLEEHMAAMNGVAQGTHQESVVAMEESDASDEWNGLADLAPLNHEEEYEDGERTATVTIEAVDVTRDGLVRADEAHKEGAVPNGRAGHENTDHHHGQNRAKAKNAAKPKWKKKKKFRYETKAESKLTRMKEQAAGKAKAKERRQQ